MSRIGFTAPCTVANTNRDGTGTSYLIFEAESPEGDFVDSVVCTALGTNDETEAVLLLTNVFGIGTTTNNSIIARKQLPATVAGAAVDGDDVVFQVGAKLPFGFKLYAIVHVTQAAGRQFTAYSDASYQLY